MVNLARRALAASRKGPGFLRTFGGNFKKLTDVDRESVGQPLKQIDGRIETPSFNVTDRGTIDFSINRKMFLTDASLRAGLPKIPSNACASVHAAQSINLPPPIPSDISDILIDDYAGGGMRRLVSASRACVAFWLAGSVAVLAQPTGSFGAGPFSSGFEQYDLSGPVLLMPADDSAPASPPNIEYRSPAANRQDAAVTAPIAIDPSNNVSLLEGWWELKGRDGCSSPDPDSWWKVAVGYMEIEDSGVTFGKGHPQFRMYDQGCDLTEIIEGGSGFEAHAICKTEDGDVIEGSAQFYPDPANGLSASTPLGDFKLTRCSAYPAEVGELDTREANGQSTSRSDGFDPPSSTPSTGAQTSPTQTPATTASQWEVVPTANGETGGAVIPEVQRNAIAHVYRDFCDPNFGTAYDLSGSTSAEFYEAYRNQLFVAYRSSCFQFLDDQVLTAVGTQHIERLLDLPPGPSRLDRNGALALGILVFLQTHEGPKACWGDRRNTVLEHYYGDLPEQLLALATKDNLWSLGGGYGSGWGQWIMTSAQRGEPYCHSLNLLVQTVVGLALLQSQNFITR